MPLHQLLISLLQLLVLLSLLQLVSVFLTPLDEQALVAVFAFQFLAAFVFQVLFDVEFPADA